MLLIDDPNKENFELANMVAIHLKENIIFPFLILRMPDAYSSQQKCVFQNLFVWMDKRCCTHS